MLSKLYHQIIELTNCIQCYLDRYLEQRDAPMHARAKAEIKDCYERNKNGDPAYKSLTQSMKARLKNTVGDEYWRKAHSYLEHFFKQKQKERARTVEQPHMSSQPPQPLQQPPSQARPHQPSQQPDKKNFLKFTRILMK